MGAFVNTKKRNTMTLFIHSSTFAAAMQQGYLEFHTAEKFNAFTEYVSSFSTRQVFDDDFKKEMLEKFNVKFLIRSTPYGDNPTIEAIPYNHGESIKIDEFDYHLTVDVRRCKIVWDEINEMYIIRPSAVRVLNGPRSGDFVYTHVETIENRREHYGIRFVSSISEYCFESFEDAEDYVVLCDGELGHINDSYYWDCDGEYHDTPESERDEEDDEENPRYIHSYSYKPRSIFFRGKGEQNINNKVTPYYGIELEIERNTDEENICSRDELAEELTFQKFDKDLAYCKFDGSLNDGLEIVTHPMSFRYIKEREEMFKNALTHIGTQGFVSHVANTCGMHIHISKDTFTTWHIFRFLKFFVDNKEFIFKISQRKRAQFEEWSNIEEMNAESLMILAKNKDGNYSRRVAVNLHNSRTVEIRIFRGNLNPERFLKNIEFVDALFCYTRDCSEITLKGFGEYIKESGQYNNLKSFIKLKNLI
jgi:hypothetical protein